jgi:hypothetical protein
MKKPKFGKMSEEELLIYAQEASEEIENLTKMLNRVHTRIAKYVENTLGNKEVAVKIREMNPSKS